MSYLITTIGSSPARLIPSTRRQAPRDHFRFIAIGLSVALLLVALVFPQSRQDGAPDNSALTENYGL